MKPISNISVIVTAVLCITMGFLSFAQEGPPASFVVEDLQLISLASVPEWDNNWEYSRAVEAATILAWLHDHGYALLLGDLNEDGVIDELDTIELADRLGEHPMGCDTPRHPTDAWLVFGLAEYVADKYPDIFELKIYDRGFPSEFERKMGRPFAPDAIPGIILTLEAEPTFAAYMKELVEEEGVILGLEEEPGRNLYFTGRSFLRDPIAPNIHGIDLVWAQEDWYEPGMQGKVLETRARQTDAFYVDYQGGWMKVESMFALSPLYPPGEGPAEACPDLIVVGSAVCVCSAPCTVTVDATVYNIGAGEVPGPFEVSLVDIVCDLHSGCPKHVTISGGDLDQLNATGSVHVTFTPIGIPVVPTWPCPTCTFTLVVDSKSEIDEDCYPAPMGEYNNIFPLDVCCDGEDERCPDLVVSGIPKCRCVETPGGTLCYVHVEARVTNIAHPIPVSVPSFNVFMGHACAGGGLGSVVAAVSGGKLSQLNATGSTTVDFLYDFMPDPLNPCCEYVLYVDSGHSVNESCYPAPDGEHNNVFLGGQCCDLPPQEGRCPDLSVFGDPSCYCYVNDRGDIVCVIQVIATVGKMGGDVGSDFEVRLNSNCSGTPGLYEKAFTVTPWQINPDNFEQVVFSYSFIPDDPMNPCCKISLQVDGPNVINETCFPYPFGEANNVWGPYGFCCPGVEEECPDLAIAGSAVCLCGSALAGTPAGTGACTVTVQGNIANIGTAPIGSTFDVTLNYSCDDGSVNSVVKSVAPSEINPTGNTTVTFTFPFTPAGPGENCCEYSLIVDSGGAITECEEGNNFAAGIVCCDVPVEECVDLTIGGVAHCICGYDLPNLASDTGYGCRMMVDAIVNVSGPGEVPTIFSIKISDVACNGPTGIVGQRPLTPSQLDALNTAGSVTILSAFSWDIPWPPGEGAPCCVYTLTVDSLGAIAECPEGAEDNNTFTDRFCCEELPGCPDIVIEITRTSCDCERVPIYEWQCIRWGVTHQPPPCLEWGDVLVGYETVCEVTVHYMVKNIGTQDAGEFHVRMESTTGDTDTAYFSGLLSYEEKTRWFDFTTDAPGSVTVTLIADNAFEVTECDEDNNTDGASIGCK